MRIQNVCRFSAKISVDQVSGHATNTLSEQFLLRVNPNAEEIHLDVKHHESSDQNEDTVKVSVWFIYSFLSVQTLRTHLLEAKRTRHKYMRCIFFSLVLTNLSLHSWHCLVLGFFGFDLFRLYRFIGL